MLTVVGVEGVRAGLDLALLLLALLAFINEFNARNVGELVGA